MQFIYVLVLLVASAVLTALTSRRPKNPPPAAFSDFQTPQSTEGTAIAVVFGDVWCDDWMVLWFGNYASLPIYAQSSKGK